RSCTRGFSRSSSFRRSHLRSFATAAARCRPHRPSPRRRSRDSSDTVEVIRAVDRDIATGVYSDMTEHGWDRDDWPQIHEQVMAADILVLCAPIWLGEKSSICTRVIERLYGNSHLLNDAGQYAYYGRVG